MQTEPRLVKGGLAPWQERRAKEMLVADLAGATPLAEMATACGLSPGHFARAFRRSTGLAPHAWLLKARVEHAIGVIKRIFGFQKVRYRGLAKNLHRLEVTAALANLFMARRRLCHA